MSDPTSLAARLPDALPRAVIEEMLVNRARVDAAFRQQLINDPRAAMTDFFGAPPPSEFDLQTVVENAATFYYVVSNPAYFTSTVSVRPNRIGMRVGFQGQVAARLASDPDFRDAFAADPKAAVEEGLNLTFPDGVDLRVLQETGSTIYFVLPYAPHQSLLMGPYSLQFDGAAACVTVPDAPELYVQDAVTVEAWLRTPDASPNGTLVSWSDGATGWELRVEAGRPVFTVFAGGSAYTASPAGASYGLRPGRWIYLVGLYTGQSAQLYVNGLLAAEVDAGGSLDPFDGGLALGRRAGGSVDGTYFNGQIHEVRLWGDAAAPSYIQDNRTCRSDVVHAPQEQLLAHYPMEEGAGLRLADASRFAHDGTLSGATWVATGLDSPP